MGAGSRPSYKEVVQVKLKGKDDEGDTVIVCRKIKNEENPIPKCKFPNRESCEGCEMTKYLGDM